MVRYIANGWEYASWSPMLTHVSTCPCAKGGAGDVCRGLLPPNDARFTPMRSLPLMAPVSDDASSAPWLLLGVIGEPSWQSSTACIGLIWSTGVSFSRRPMQRKTKGQDAAQQRSSGDLVAGFTECLRRRNRGARGKSSSFPFSPIVPARPPTPQMPFDEPHPNEAKETGLSPQRCAEGFRNPYWDRRFLQFSKSATGVAVMSRPRARLPNRFAVGERDVTVHSLGTGPFFGGKTYSVEKRRPKTWTCPLPRHEGDSPL